MPKNTIADCARKLRERSTVTKGGCAEWRGAKGRKGYGVLNLDGISVKAHRVAYIVAKGSIPEGAHVLHKCDNPSCVNPSHLMLGSNTDNIADKVAKDRASKRLTKESAMEIKGMIREGVMSQTAIARLYDVAQSTVSRIGAGLRRPYLEGRV